MNNSPLGAFFIILVLVIVALCWRLSLALGLNIETGFPVVMRAGIVLIIFGTILYVSSFSILQYALTWAILIACLSVTFWPAIDMWASGDYDYFFSHYNDTPWWGSWYTKIGGFLGIIAAGFLIDRARFSY